MNRGNVFGRAASVASRSRFIVAIAVLILVGFSLPPGAVGGFIKGKRFLSIILSDPLLHVYGLFIFAFFLALDLRYKSGGSFPFIRAAGWSIAYGLFIEIFQWILPYRAFEFADLAWNVLGIALGLLAAWVFFPGKMPKTEIEEAG